MSSVLWMANAMMIGAMNAPSPKKKCSAFMNGLTLSW